MYRSRSHHHRHYLRTLAGFALALALPIVAAPFGTWISAPLGAQDGGGGAVARHFYAIENLDREQVDRRGIAGDLGKLFSNLVIAPNTDFRLWVLNSQTLKISRTHFTTGGPGTNLRIPRVLLFPHSSLDHDDDGLPDLAELIVGTGVDDSDTDDDGISDGAEVRQATNPLDGRPVRIGVVASVALPGEARDLCVSDDMLVVAHGTDVTGFNVFTGMTPVILFRATLPGSANRVACTGRQIAVALGAAGVALLDAADLAQVETNAVVFTAALDSTSITAVVTTPGVAYVGTSGGRVFALSLDTGTVFGSVTVGGSIADLAVGGDVLYAATGLTVHALPLEPSDLHLVGSATGSNPFGAPHVRLIAGGGAVYGVHFRGPTAFGLADPLRPTVLKNNNLISTFIADIALNGSGSAVFAMNFTGATAPNDVYLYDYSDPTATPSFLTSIATPGDANAVEIANGLAYVADGTSGLQVVNFLAFDTGATPPSIALDTGFPLAGVEEGRLTFVEGVAADDVQVRSVEIVIDGTTTNDASFPFELHFTVPRKDAGDTFALRARAFDTGGNFTWSDIIEVPVSDDTTAPQILGVAPTGGVVGPAENLTALFSEDLDPDSVVPSALRVVSIGADRLEGSADDGGEPRVASAEYFASRIVSFTVPDLGTGLYRAEIDTVITDASGVPLANGSEWYFYVYENTDIDADGVLDGLEDFDGDGLINAYEVVLGLDPLVDDFVATSDTDGDGVLDLAELRLGSSATDTDSDGDGFEDGDEVTLLSNPLDPRRLPLGLAYQTLSLVNLAQPGYYASEKIAIRNDNALERMDFATETVSARNDIPPVRDQAGPIVISVENESP